MENVVVEERRADGGIALCRSFARSYSSDCDHMFFAFGVRLGSVPAFFFGRFRFGFGVDVVVGLCVLYCVEKLLVLKNVKVMSFFV